MAITNFRAGSVVTDTPANIVTGRAYVTTAGHYSGLLVNDANYQVPAGKTLYITKIVVGGSTAGAKLNIYTDTAAVAPDAAACTAPKNMAGAYNVTTAGKNETHDVMIPVAATLYPVLTSDSAHSYVTMTCYVV